MKNSRRLEGFADEVAVGQRHRRVEAEEQQALDAAVVDRFEQRHGRQSGMRDGGFLDAPHAGDVFPVRRVLEVARARQLIAFLSLLARALAVALAGDHRVAAAFAPDAARGHHQVDGGHAVLDALRVVLDAAGVQQEAGLGRPPHFGRAHDHRGGHARDGRRVFRGVALDDGLDGVPAGGMRRDELAVDPAALHHDVQHAVEDADVAARAHGDEEVGGAGDRRHARIEHDELRAVLARLPEIVGGDRGALGDVRARDENHLRLRDVAPRVGAAIDAENLLRRGRRRHHAEPAVVVDVGGAHGHPCELAHQVRLLVGQRGAGQHGEGVPSVGGLDALDLARGTVERGVPVDRLEAARLVANERRQQPIRMLVLHVALHALGAELPLVEGELLPRLEADDLLVLHLELDAALLAAEAAVCRHDPVGLAARGPAAGRLPVEMRAELRHEIRDRGRQSGHYAPRLQSASCVNARFLRRQAGQMS